ncbi:DUF397 domain-containing protein [Actinokineospora iranica]|uniref:DUF397 domain-containing protein n=1 Tax=Actinokineospora iranica TaxID=1271860 RepID=UPI001E623707|nr:DUF397 domain-containing protein [Actinokineospora iranica]
MPPSLTRRKSTRSSGGSANCVEAAHRFYMVALHNSKNSDSPIVIVPRARSASSCAARTHGLPSQRVMPRARARALRRARLRKCARRAASARCSRSSAGSDRVGSTWSSNRTRAARRAGAVRALRSVVLAHDA